MHVWHKIPPRFSFYVIIFFSLTSTGSSLPLSNVCESNLELGQNPREIEPPKSAGEMWFHEEISFQFEIEASQFPNRYPLLLPLIWGFSLLFDFSLREFLHMKDPLDRTKVVLRHLPPGISQSALMEQIDGRFAGRYKWFCFRPGKNRLGFLFSPLFPYIIVRGSYSNFFCWKIGDSVPSLSYYGWENCGFPFLCGFCFPVIFWVISHTLIACGI